MGSPGAENVGTMMITLFATQETNQNEPPSRNAT
jgi:hypothetical protein